MAQVLQEFLIAITAHVDPQSLARVRAAINQGVLSNQQQAQAAGQLVGNAIGRGITIAVANHTRQLAHDVQNVFEGLTRIAQRVTRLASYGITAAAANFGILAHRLDELHAVSERTGASVANIRALDLAVRLIGGTSADASSAIEGLSDKLRENPGMRGYLSGLGVSETKDTVRMVEQLSTSFSRMPAYLARQHGAVLGLSPEVVRLLQSGHFAAEMERARSVAAAWKGLDQAKLAESAKKFVDQWRILLTHADFLNQRLMEGFLNSKALDKFNELIRKYAGPLSEALGEFGNNLSKFIDENAESFMKWLSDPETPQRFVDAFKEVKKFALEIKDAIVEIAKVIREVYAFLTQKDPMGMGGAVTGAMDLWRDPQGTIKRWLGGGAGGGAGVGNGGAEGMTEGGGSTGGGGRKPIGERLSKAWEGRPKIFGGTGEGVFKGLREGSRSSGLAPPGPPGTYRPQYSLSAADTSDAVINTIAGEARMKDPSSVDAVINNMFNRLGTKWGGVANDNLQAVARAPGQYEGYRKATPQEAELIRNRIQEIAKGGVPDNTKGANTFRASGYGGMGSPWYRNYGQYGEVVGGNRFAYDPSMPNGPYAPYDKPKETAGGVLDQVKSVAQRAINIGAAAAAGAKPQFDRFQDLERMKLTGQYGFSRANITSSPAVNDNSRSVEFKPTYNTNIETTDVKQAATSFQRAHESLNDIGARHLSGWSR